MTNYAYVIMCQMYDNFNKHGIPLQLNGDKIIEINKVEPEGIEIITESGGNYKVSESNILNICAEIAVQ